MEIGVLKEMNKALEEKYKALKERNEALKKRNEALEERNEALEEENKALKKRVELLERSVDALCKQNNKHYDKLCKLEEDLRLRRGELMLLRKNHHALQADNANVVRELRDATVELISHQLRGRGRSRSRSRKHHA